MGRERMTLSLLTQSWFHSQAWPNYGKFSACWPETALNDWWWRGYGDEELELLPAVFLRNEFFMDCLSLLCILDGRSAPWVSAHILGGRSWAEKQRGLRELGSSFFFSMMEMVRCCLMVRDSDEYMTHHLCWRGSPLFYSSGVCFSYSMPLEFAWYMEYGYITLMEEMLRSEESKDLKVIIAGNQH